MKDSSPRCETGRPEGAALFRAGKTAERWKFIQLLGIIPPICISLFPFGCYNRGNRSSHDAEDRKASGELHQKIRCSPAGEGRYLCPHLPVHRPGSKGPEIFALSLNRRKGGEFSPQQL